MYYYAVLLCVYPPGIRWKFNLCPLWARIYITRSVSAVSLPHMNCADRRIPCSAHIILNFINFSINSSMVCVIQKRFVCVQCCSRHVWYVLHTIFFNLCISERTLGQIYYTAMIINLWVVYYSIEICVVVIVFNELCLILVNVAIWKLQG